MANTVALNDFVYDELNELKGELSFGEVINIILDHFKILSKKDQELFLSLDSPMKRSFFYMGAVYNALVSRNPEMEKELEIIDFQPRTIQRILLKMNNLVYSDEEYSYLAGALEVATTELLRTNMYKISVDFIQDYFELGFLLNL